MIILTKLGGKKILLNDEHIEIAVETPDTVITMTNGNSYIVVESIEEIIEKSVAFRRNARHLLRSRAAEEDKQ